MASMVSASRVVASNRSVSCNATVRAAPCASPARPMSAIGAPGAGFSSFAGKALVSRAPRAAARARSSVKAMASSEEISYIMIKPDGVQRGLVGDIISRFERKGFTLKALKLYQCPREVAEEHYKDLSSKPFYKDLVDYICSGPVVAMVWSGAGVVKSARLLIGATNPLEAAPGTIRGDLAVEVGRNVVHGSDSVENGVREANLWFGEGSIVEWDPTMTPWLRE